jgi:hypothetical protein
MWRDPEGLSRDTYNPDPRKHGGPHVDRYNRAGQNVGRYRPDGSPLGSSPPVPKSDVGKFQKAVEKLNKILGKGGGKIVGLGIGVLLGILIDADEVLAGEEEMLECMRLGGRKSECLQQ